MDWQVAIDRNREALLSIIVALMRTLGLVKGGALTTLPFNVYRKALMILRPAEAAARRLIMMAAYDMELRGVKVRLGVPASGLPLKGGAECVPASGLPLKGGAECVPASGLASLGGAEWVRASSSPRWADFAPSFNLIDPLKSFTTGAPDYSLFGPSHDAEHGSCDKTPTPAAGLGRRLLALKNALDSVHKQARRLTRWYHMRDAALAQNRPHRLSPLRPGLPPGYRRKPAHPIEEVLLDCHSLAQYARERGAFPSLMEHQTIKENATRKRIDSG